MAVGYSACTGEYKSVHQELINKMRDWQPLKSLAGTASVTKDALELFAVTLSLDALPQAVQYKADKVRIVNNIIGVSTVIQGAPYPMLFLINTNDTTVMFDIPGFGVNGRDGAQLPAHQGALFIPLETPVRTGDLTGQGTVINRPTKVDQIRTPEGETFAAAGQIPIFDIVLVSCSIEQARMFESTIAAVGTSFDLSEGTAKEKLGKSDKFTGLNFEVEVENRIVADNLENLL